MNTRLKQIRLDHQMSQEEFGKTIGIESRAHISALENGNRNITDRIVNDVCREFNVSEEWLRTGEGEMQLPYTDSLAHLLGQIAAGDDDLIKDLIVSYMELDATSKQALRQIRDNMLAKQKEREQK